MVPALGVCPTKSLQSEHSSKLLEIILFQFVLPVTYAARFVSVNFMVGVLVSLIF